MVAPRIVVPAAAGIALAVWLMWTADAPHSTGAPGPSLPPPPPTEVTAAELIAAYDTNEIAADRRFEGSRVVVVATIDDIGEELDGRPSVTFNPSDGVVVVKAIFGRDEADVVASFSKGQRVRLECIGKGNAIGEIRLEECAVAAPRSNRRDPVVGRKVAPSDSDAEETPAGPTKRRGAHGEA